MHRGVVAVAVALALSLACGGGMTSGASERTPALSAAKPPPEGLPERLELTLHRERTQGAFTILVPSGWTVEGGLGSSGVPGSVIDLVETNIRFRFIRPDGRAWVEFFPKVLFTEPFDNPFLPLSVGDNYNGTFIQPWMSPSQYVSTLVLPWFRPELTSLRVTGHRPVSRYQDLVPPTTPFLLERASELVLLDSNYQGQPTQGRVYTVLARFGTGGIVNWAHAATFGYFAPTGEMESLAPMLELCLNSFRFDPDWVARYVQATAGRAEAFGDLQRTVQQIDADIAAGGDQTRSDIMHEEWKVLTDQVEMRDPTTGQAHLFPSYDNAWTDGQGNYLLSNQAVELPPEWQSMSEVNRLR